MLHELRKFHNQRNQQLSLTTSTNNEGLTRIVEDNISCIPPLTIHVVNKAFVLVPVTIHDQHSSSSLTQESAHQKGHVDTHVCACSVQHVCLTAQG